MTIAHTIGMLGGLGRLSRKPICLSSTATLQNVQLVILICSFSYLFMQSLPTEHFLWTDTGGEKYTQFTL